MNNEIEPEESFPIYDSNTDRPYVKAHIETWKNRHELAYVVWSYGIKRTHTNVIHAADDILRNYALHGGYAEPHYMESLKRLVAYIKKVQSSLYFSQEIIGPLVGSEWMRENN